ncbi:MAG TPA: hypothetical protein VFS40_16720, partial [Gemmatimonadales bacterium]|nr:hypothetical protein [Gemmatimonadales bacterium]
APPADAIARVRPDWARGRVRDDGERQLGVLGFFALVWNAIAWGSFAAAWTHGGFARKPAAFFILLFPAIGLALLASVGVGLARRRRFGRTVLELRGAEPLAAGGALEAALVTGGALPAAAPVRLVLTVLRRVTTGSGKDRSTREDVLWQDALEAHGRAERRYDGMRTVVPVAWRLPPALPPATLMAQGDGIVWRLEAGAALAGADFRATFALPVLRAGAARDEAETTPGVIPVGAESLADYRPPADSRIVVRREGGAVVADFPPARNRGAAASLTLFAALWTAVCAALVGLGAPLLFVLVFGLFDVLLVWGVLALWLQRSRATASARGLEVRSGLFSLGRARLLSPGDVRALEVARGMQAGTTAYFTISVVDARGRRVALGRDVREVREAEWIAGRLAAALAADAAEGSAAPPPVRFSWERR